MKSFIKFIVIFGGILLLSAFLAPILYEFLPKLFQLFGWDKVYKFERIFNRLVMIGSLAGVIFFVRIKKETLIKYGLNWNNNNLGLLSKSFGFGFLILVLLVLFEIVTGNAIWVSREISAWKWIERLGVSLFACFLIGVIEEFFFRGFIFQTFKNKFRWSVVISVIVTSVFYSLIHFVSAKKPFIGADPVFFDSLRLIAAPFKSFANFPEFWPAAVGLFIFGLILNDLVIRTGSLYPAIGLHAGCVFFIKIDGLFIHFFDYDPFIWGSKKMYDGMIGWVFLLMLWLVARKFFLSKKDKIIEDNIG